MYSVCGVFEGWITMGNESNHNYLDTCPVACVCYNKILVIHTVTLRAIKKIHLLSKEITTKLCHAIFDIN